MALILGMWLPDSALSAEVYYLGGAGAQGSGQMNPPFSLKQRMHDLFDFGAYGTNNNARSGRITGILSQEVSWNMISGNKAKSFLEGGVDYVTETNINIQEKLWKDYDLESQIFLRKTDDRRAEPRKDVRMKQFNAKISNARDLYEFGDFYADFSAFTLSSSLEGLHVETTPADLYTIKMVAARSAAPDGPQGTFQRNVVGAKTDWDLFRGSDLFSAFRIGVQAVTNQDDSSTITASTTTKDLRNTVVGIDGDISFARHLSLNYEIARSAHVEDDDLNTTSVKDEQYGTAFRLQPSLDLGKFRTRYLYYYVQPGFYTDIGSAAADKIQHQVNVDYQFSRKATLNLMQNWYWDHLKNSARTQRTIYDEKSVSLNCRPFDGRKSFTFRPYVSYQQKHSDDPANSAEGATRTAGFSVNDNLDDKTSVGASYEYRSYKDEAAKTSSDYFNRIGLYLARESRLFARRLYQSLGPNMDLRRTKRDSDHDVSFSTSYTGQLDISKKWLSRWGYNVQIANNAAPAQDYINHRNYLEMDFLVYEKRNAHFVIRGERNRYDHENGDQTYKETRVIGKFTINF